MSELQSTRKAADYALRRRALSHRTRGSANLPQEPDRRSSSRFQAFPDVLKMSQFPSWPGLVPAIHVFLG
jgi:hypothetical protein